MGQALSQAATGEETEEVWLRCTARGDCQNFRLTQSAKHGRLEPENLTTLRGWATAAAGTASTPRVRARGP